MISFYFYIFITITFIFNVIIVPEIICSFSYIIIFFRKILSSPIHSLLRSVCPKRLTVLSLKPPTLFVIGSGILIGLVFFSSFFQNLSISSIETIIGLKNRLFSIFFKFFSLNIFILMLCFSILHINKNFKIKI